MTPGPFAALISDDLGEVTARDDGYFDVRYERRLRKPVAKVWAAITVAERIADWFTDVDIELWVGGRYHIRFADFEGMVVEGVVTAVEAERRLTHTWPDPGHPDATITYELEPDGEGCRLVFTQIGLPPQYLGAIPGWHAFFEALPGACEGIRTPWTAEREAEMGERYRDLLAPFRGPEGAAPV